jgi:hypothetical protein
MANPTVQCTATRWNSPPCTPTDGPHMVSASPRRPSMVLAACFAVVLSFFLPCPQAAQGIVEAHPVRRHGVAQAALTLSATLRAAVRLFVSTGGETLSSGSLDVPQVSTRVKFPLLPVSEGGGAEGGVRLSSALGSFQADGVILNGRAWLAPINIRGTWSGYGARLAVVLLGSVRVSGDPPGNAIPVVSDQPTGGHIRRISTAQGPTDAADIHVWNGQSITVYIGWFVPDGRPSPNPLTVTGDCEVTLRVR